MFCSIYRNRRVLVTGHTGFKGSWLVLWLQLLGAEIAGIALPAESSPNHWDLLGLNVESHMVDIRNAQALRQLVVKLRPEIVFHLAAQPLVRRSYRQPLDTLATNVLGTANLLDACRDCEGVMAIVVVTSDKCYENREWVWGYREIDPLGGYDPYSASKGCTELVAASYRHSFFSGSGGPLLATARAGNVIGGGDWSEDRLIPDLVRSVGNGETLEIRSPEATRPWQHVLESLSGYLLLGQHLINGRRDFAEAWNFGPNRDGNREVAKVLEAIRSQWPEVKWRYTQSPQVHESRRLYLDSSKSREKLLWRPVWRFEESIEKTVQWYKKWASGDGTLSRDQLLKYIDDAGRRKMPWVEEGASP